LSWLQYALVVSQLLPAQHISPSLPQRSQVWSGEASVLQTVPAWLQVVLLQQGCPDFPQGRQLVPLDTVPDGQAQVFPLHFWSPGQVQAQVPEASQAWLAPQLPSQQTPLSQTPDWQRLSLAHGRPLPSFGWQVPLHTRGGLQVPEQHVCPMPPHLGWHVRPSGPHSSAALQVPTHLADPWQV
jgi:hypothetical protein